MRRSSVFLALLALTACGPGATPEATIRAWADAAKAGDYATAESLMRGDDFAKLTWREPHIRYRKAGRLQQYELLGEPITTGQSTTATLRWTGNIAPLCITVQVDTNGKLRPRSDYHVCPGEVTP